MIFASRARIAVGTCWRLFVGGVSLVLLGLCGAESLVCGLVRVVVV